VEDGEVAEVGAVVAAEVVVDSVDSVALEAVADSEAAVQDAIFSYGSIAWRR
jgi:hypothetical protein